MTQQTNELLKEESIDTPPNAGVVAAPSVATQHFHPNSFIIEDTFYRSRLPKATHWSVAWSDLMMTMFILFLSMFVYQATQKDFLVSKTPEIIGGSTMDAIEMDAFQDLIVPIVPLSHNAPLISSGTVLQVEKVTLDEVDIDEVYRDDVSSPSEGNAKDIEPELPEKKDAPLIEDTVSPVIITEITPSVLPEPDVLEPDPILDGPEIIADEKTKDIFSEKYDLSKESFDGTNIEKFASIEVVPDKTMRIILTGDLLFSLGQAELSPSAKQSLMKIAAVIKHTPYMINVIGHTDNSPMNSPLFASNWELSVVRASRVTRFLIAATLMNPQQFIVSGYGSHRPRKPNNNTTNRAANRRVEIIISKRLAPAVQATSANIL